MRIQKVPFRKAACAPLLAMLMTGCGGGSSDGGDSNLNGANGVDGVVETVGHEDGSAPIADYGSDNYSAEWNSASGSEIDNVTIVDDHLDTDFSIARVDWLDPVVRTGDEKGFALTADRDISLRVFLNSSNGSTKTPPVRLQVNSKNGDLLLDELIKVDNFIDEQAPNLSNAKGTFRYKLKGEWIQPGVKISLAIEAADLDASNNTWAQTPNVTPAQVYYLTLVALQVTGEKEANLPSETKGDATTSALVKANLMASYPFSNVKIRIVRPPVQSSKNREDGTWGTWLSDITTLEKALRANDQDYGYYYGFVTPKPGGTTIGNAYMPGFTATGQAPNKPDGTETNNWRGTMIHEEGHNFTLGHTSSCNTIASKDQAADYEPTWGYDARYDRMIDPQEYSILLTTASGCKSAGTWWSQDQYNRVQTRLNTVKNVLRVPPLSSSIVNDWK
ncbi:MAG: M66 family metalloprotease [Chromatiales bacterium]|jgi:hypothetical protein|nr:M66 family metalloprotease [Chromatiales bacterium]